jgi:hypothetical protein
VILPIISDMIQMRHKSSIFLDLSDEEQSGGDGGVASTTTDEETGLHVLCLCRPYSVCVSLELIVGLLEHGRNRQ